MQCFSFLSAKDSKTAETIINDVRPAITCEWALAGSLSFRLLLPENPCSSRLGDIDIVVFTETGNDIATLVSPKIKNSFHVTHIYGNEKSGYYFGLLHKLTNKWVDIYTYSRVPKTIAMKIDGLDIKVQTPEETFYAIIKDLMWRHKEHKIVKEKWLNTANFLWSNIDRQQTLALMENNNEWRSLTSLTHPHEVINFALTQVTVNLRQFGKKGQPQDCVTTPNGISIEAPEFYK